MGVIWIDSGRFGRAWTPADITTALWLDAADAGTVTTVNSAVSQWNDKSGNNRHATQSTAGSRPGYSGGHIAFNGSTFLSCTPGWGPYWEWLLVAKFDRTDVTQVPIRDTGAAGATAIVGYATNSTSFYRVRETENTAYSTRIAVEFGTTRFIHGFSSRSSNTAFAFVNGSQKTSWGVTGIMGATLFFGTNVFNGGVVTPGLQGSISEFILLSAEASDSTRQRIEGYLAHKWGLAANLPNDHPYKSAAPTL